MTRFAGCENERGGVRRRACRMGLDRGRSARVVRLSERTGGSAARSTRGAIHHSDRRGSRGAARVRRRPRRSAAQPDGRGPRRASRPAHASHCRRSVGAALPMDRARARWRAPPVSTIVVAKCASLRSARRSPAGRARRPRDAVEGAGGTDLRDRHPARRGADGMEEHRGRLSRRVHPPRSLPPSCFPCPGVGRRRASGDDRARQRGPSTAARGTAPANQRGRSGDRCGPRRSARRPCSAPRGTG